ncbi:toxin VasX [Salinisphaera sp. Q1T1-3]|uniref:toxin VasX n=1 Tax=Salinisphaera sp. Q1T1-3 TaxID=2321229 RepID=UPI000E757B89|nr:toxin VasX [Salinisphaera sp. Q1T1-3]RJS91678.1 hypothetical protein D3260_14605 [Salinisphaera sp. Q1T1-3]
MSTDATTTRVLDGEIDHDGNHVFQHVLTPSSQTGVVKLRMQFPDAIPIYPVRYGLIRRKDAPSLPGKLDTSAYPSLAGDYQWGARALRPRSFVYLLYHDKVDDSFVVKGFQVTQDARFTPLSAAAIRSVEEPKADKSGNIAPHGEKGTLATDEVHETKINGLTLSNAGTLPYLPAPGPEIADSVQLLVCDTILTEQRCRQLEADRITLSAPWNDSLDGWRTSVATTVVPHGNAEQNDTFDAKELPTGVADMAASYPARRKPAAWSESRPDTPDGTRTANAMNRAVPATDDQPNLAVALHDPVGALSEINNLLGRRMYELGAYSADASRKLFASNAIDQLVELGEENAKKSFKRAFLAAPDVKGPYAASPPSISPGAIREREHAADAIVTREKRSERLSYVADDSARRQFVQDHLKHKQKLVDAVSEAGTDAWAVFQAVKPRYEATMALYDVTTLSGFFDVTRVAAQTLPALTQSKSGIKHLDNEMPDTGPTGMTGWMLAGHPDVQSYISAAASVAVTGAASTSGSTAKSFTTLLEKMPPRDESRMLSLMMAGLKARGMKEPYLRLMQLWEGKLIKTERMSFPEMLEFVKKEHNASGVGPFRPQHAKALDGSRPSTNAARLYEMQSVKDAAVKADQANADALAKAERFWRNIHVGGSALVLLISAWNAEKAFQALGREDGLTFANGLSAAGGTFATGAAGAALGDAANQAASRAARHAGNDALADTRKAFAEKCATYMIGLGSAAAIMAAAQHFAKAGNESGTAKALDYTVTAIDATAGLLGFYAILSRGATGFLEGAIPELGLGPAGWILFAATALDTILSYWAEVAADNHARNEWIARSIWGNGRDTDKATFTNQDEAVQAFFQLVAPPRIDTDTEWLNSIENTFIPGPWEKTNRSTKVSLPNWGPGESYYSIKQSRSSLYHAVQHFSNRPAEIKDGAKELKVELDGKVGTLQFESHNEGAIEVTYWPYGATDGRLVLTASND